jgi:hypothetical protein
MFRTLRQRVRPSTTRLRVEPLEDRRMLAAGDLDPTWGGDGTVQTDIGGGHNGAFATEKSWWGASHLA